MVYCSLIGERLEAAIDPDQGSEFNCWSRLIRSWNLLPAEGAKFVKPFYG